MTATSAIIPASGLGRRLSNSLSGKAFLDIAGQPLIAHTIAAFQAHPDIDDIVIVVRRDDRDAVEALVQERGFSKVHSIVLGGKERQDSVRNGLAAVPDESEIVAIHDVARPLVTQEIISRSIEAARKHDAAIAAVRVIDTVKSSEDGEFVGETLERRKLFAVQTPQTFSAKVLRAAYERAYADGYYGTDDASLVERLGVPVRLVEGSYENLKVTTPSDIPFVEAIMMERAGRYDVSASSMTRVGHGYDIHRFAPGRKLFLGGVYFPEEEGLLGHSDADVLLHAVADALLGAAAMGDIGRHFPDTDPAYKDACSLDLLSHVGKVIGKHGWTVRNIDVTLIAQRPRVAGRVPEMCENMAKALQIEAGQISVKATTAEGLGAIGEGLGIECHAVALLEGTVG